ncbi:molybdate ABC transporter substrate-binding protein [Allohahella marinimesophila]|uniref:molybdate ABC transporter substrate-binding protein n=1 Tax=Allohahella marinimesophila TaxID=1054972 RepID=UPI0031D3CD8C
MKLLKTLCASAAVVGLLILPQTIAAETVSLAVASNFAGPMAHIIEAFEADSGHEVQLSLGSSGKLYAQISHGAPFEVLLSADQRVPKQLEQGGLGVPGTRFTYAVGQLVLWSPTDSVVDDAGDILKSRGFEKLAIANPRLAPYGAAAVEVLQALGRFDALKPRLIMGENIAQTYHFVSTANAELGFVAAAQVMRNGQLSGGSAWLVPQHLYTPIRQDALLLRNGADNPAARALLDFIRTPAALKIIRSYGYVQQTALHKATH